MAAWVNVCRFVPTLGGTTDFTYSSAVTGYSTPALAGIVNSRVYKWRAESIDLSQWEIFEGAYNTGTGVAARTTVLANSSGTGTAAGQSGAGSKINFSTVPQVSVVAIKEDLISIEEANAFSDVQKAQARSNIAAISVPDVILEEQQAAGTAGGTFTSGAFQTRLLNTFVRNSGTIGSLSSNQVTLGAGTYYFKWMAIGVACENHQTQLYNVTDATSVGSGTSIYSPAASISGGPSEGSAVVTIAGAKAFALRHRCNTTRATNGYGVAANFGITEVYSRLEITKIT